MTAPIGITMGDPAGVGPEIIVKSLAAMTPETRRGYRIFGNADSLAAAERVLATGLDLSALVPGLSALFADSQSECPAAGRTADPVPGSTRNGRLKAAWPACGRSRFRSGWPCGIWRAIPRLRDRIGLR